MGSSDLSLLLGAVAIDAGVAVGCAALRRWGPKNRWLAVLLGLHLGPLGWLVILVAPRRLD
ncbi:MAG: hypothetical protein ABI743_02080 [bacterium]